MTIPSEIVTLWRQHSTAPFPRGYDGKKVNGIDLSLLDAEIAGFIRVYMNQETLDFQQMRNLRERLIDLNTIILLLNSEELAYFNRLRELANLVVQEAETH